MHNSILKLNRFSLVYQPYCITCIALVLVLFAIAPPADASKKTIQTQGSALISGDMTYDQARTLALNRARAEGIAQAAGVSVNQGVMVEGGVVTADVIKTLSKGFIVDEKIVRWQTDWAPGKDKNEPAFPQLTVTLHSTIEVPERSFIRSYMFNAHLNQTTFRNGEHVVFNVEPKEDIYLLIVNYTSRGAIVPVFPNAYSRNNFIPSGRFFKYPDPDSKDVQIEITTFQHHDNDTEAFLLFALPKDEDTKKIPWADIFPAGEEMAYAAFHEKLLSLPLQWLGEKVLIYTVHKI